MGNLWVSAVPCLPVVKIFDENDKSQDGSVGSVFMARVQVAHSASLFTPTMVGNSKLTVLSSWSSWSSAWHEGQGEGICTEREGQHAR